MKLFLPQATLEEWAIAEKADLQDGKLVVKESKSTYPVTAAVHFARLVSGEDLQKLLGRVKSNDSLADLKAEHLGDSCLVGDTAYEVVQGYLAEVAISSPAEKGDTGKKKSTSPEADLLAAFILDKL